MSVQERKQRLTEILQPVVEGMGFEYVGCDCVIQGEHSLLRVYIDGSAGVNIDQCAKVSRQLNAALSVEDVISGAYRLEVSSPGLERPLFTLDHFKQFIGKLVRIKLTMPFEQQSNFVGELMDVQDDNILLKTEAGEKSFLFSNVAKANLIYQMQKGLKKKF